MQRNQCKKCMIIKNYVKNNSNSIEFVDAIENGFEICEKSQNNWF